MEAHLVNSLGAGWEIPAYDNGVFIGTIRLTLMNGWDGYKVAAKLEEES